MLSAPLAVLEVKVHLICESANVSAPMGVRVEARSERIYGSSLKLTESQTLGCTLDSSVRCSHFTGKLLSRSLQ